MIKDSLKELQAYIENEDYKGFDPYDALKSPFFKLPFLKSNKLIRFGTQQLVKRLPFSIRPLLLVLKGYNPVTLGLSIQAYAYLYKAEPENREEHLQKIDFLIQELKKLIPEGFSGACWGYDFDWEARNAKIPAYQPTVVATGIITNALFIAYQNTGHKDAASLIESAANFIVKDLKRTYKDDTFCFSYSPFDTQQVFNASMKGARLLAQAYSLSANNEYKELAKLAVAFVISHQKEDGSWGYSLANAGGWTDNYHTGYILDCIDEYQKLTEDFSYSTNIEKGYKFYINNFITEEGAPKFYHNNPFPIDCTAASQTILTTLRFGDRAIAKNVAAFMRDNLQKPNGSFKFRKFKSYTITTSFMRWSDAWMFAALSNLKKNT
ncbi:delta-aminolevulinic acid dehydratase [Flavobacteriaceae bacterium]|nr:delta-aminolevulinic acid dehydratase [Flavobacteriaceae bacterium]